jgi:hypothetical protein
VDTAFPAVYGWLLLRHVDGEFEVRIKDVYARQWSDPVLTYRWGELDGAMLVDPEVSHVGIYALRDAPYVRICGLDPEAPTRRTGVMPLAHLWNKFTDTGIIRIEDCQYAYSSRYTVDLVEGPYQGRNVGGPYDYSNDGAAYSGMATEFTRFSWQDNATEHTAFLGKYLATDTGVVWQIDDTDYKPFITTEGVQVFLKNRGRFFGPEIDGDVIGQEIPVWITHALLGIQQVSGEPRTHGRGSIAYLVHQCIVKLYEFAAAGGNDDLTDREAIAKICRLARGEAVFPGDVEVSEKALSTTAWRIAA